MMTHMVQELLDKLACNWVLPLSQGDYFHSQQFGRTRKVLVNVPEIVDVLQIHTYRFHETALDNPREKNFLRRLKYANLSVPRLIINRRSKDNIQSLVSMGVSSDEESEKPVKAVFPPTVLARYHYPTYGPEPFRQSQLFRRKGTGTRQFSMEHSQIVIRATMCGLQMNYVMESKSGKCSISKKCRTWFRESPDRHRSKRMKTGKQLSN